MASKGKQFKDLIHSGKIVIQPGVYDGYSARLVEAAGFRLGAISGAGLPVTRGACLRRPLSNIVPRA